MKGPNMYQINISDIRLKKKEYPLMTNDSDPRKERFSLTDATHILTNAKFKNLLTIIVYINKENTQNIKYGAHQIFVNSDIHSSTLFSVERS